MLMHLTATIEVMIFAIIVLLGLAFGSFITALTWRLHEGKDFVAGRSECESCGHVLSALDLMPVISWLMLGGRCRYCRQIVSWQNPAIEIATVLLFVVSYIYWPFPLVSPLAWASFGLWLVYIILLVALVVYDLRWMLLPDKLVFTLIALGLVDVDLRLASAGNLSIVSYIQQVALGALVFSGFYGFLYLISKGRWIGLGDVKLGLFIGIVLGWRQGFVALFMANLIGLVVVAPGLFTGKISIRSRIPFGPFLIAAFIIVGLFGTQILDWYFSLILPQ